MSQTMHGRLAVGAVSLLVAVTGAVAVPAAGVPADPVAAPVSVPMSALVPVSAQPDRINPKVYTTFVRALPYLKRSLDGLHTTFVAMSDWWRDLANQIQPLIGSPEPEDQAELIGLLGMGRTQLMAHRTWAERTAPTWALRTFTKRYRTAWTTTAEQRQFTRAVGTLRGTIADNYFGQAVAGLLEGAEKLVNEDVTGFWDSLAVAEGAEAFAAQQIGKDYKALSRL